MAHPERSGAVSAAQSKDAQLRWRVCVLILLCAAGLRFYRFSDIRHNIDQAYPVAQAIALTQEGWWPALGQNTSVAVANPAGMSYLLVLPIVLFQSAWGTHFFVIALNLLVVPLTYRIARLVGPPVLAEAAMFLAAASPWLIRYSHATWVQGLVPLGSALTLYLFLRAARRPSARRWAAGLTSLTALTQTYLLAFLALAQAGVALLLNWRRVAWRGVALGALVFAVAAGLYGYQLVLQWPDQSARFTSFVQGDVTSAQSRWTALEHAVRYVTGKDYEMDNGNDGTAAWQWRHTLTQAWSAALTLLLISGAALTFFSPARDWRLLWAWWLIPIILMTVTRFPVHIMYLLLTVPVGFVLAARALMLIWRRPVGVAVALLWFGHAAWLIAADRAWVAAHPAGDLLDHLSYRAVAQFQNTARPLIDRYGLTEIYAPLDSASLTAKTGRVLTAMNLASPELLIAPLERPAVYVRQGLGHAPDLWPQAQRAALLTFPADDTLAWDVFPARTRAEWAAVPQHVVDWPTAQGLTLLGYDVDVTARALTVYWLVEALAEERGDWIYAPYAHLSNAPGQVLVNVGGPGLQGGAYRLGDVFISRMALPEIESQTYQLELGFYDGVHGLGVTFWPPEAPPQPAYMASLVWP